MKPGLKMRFVKAGSLFWVCYGDLMNGYTPKRPCALGRYWDFPFPRPREGQMPTSFSLRAICTWVKGSGTSWSSGLAEAVAASLSLLLRSARCFLLSPAPTRAPASPPPPYGEASAQIDSAPPHHAFPFSSQIYGSAAPIGWLG